MEPSTCVISEMFATLKMLCLNGWIFVADVRNLFDEVLQDRVAQSSCRGSGWLTEALCYLTF